MVALVHKNFHDNLSYDVVTLHSNTGDVTLPCEVLDSTSFYATILFSSHSFDYGLYGPHTFYSNHNTSFSEVPSNPQLVEPCN